MTKATTFKAISFAAVIAVTTSFSATAFAHDLSKADENISAGTQQTEISKSNARNLVKTLLRREYGGEGYSARAAHRVGDKWVITIKDRTKTVATASVDTKTGNINVQ